MWGTELVYLVLRAAYTTVHRNVKHLHLWSLKCSVHSKCSPRRLDSNGDLKVGDFGLAEDMYAQGYFRQGEAEGVKLPYKWLAMESLNDAIFNEKTDVVCCY